MIGTGVERYLVDRVVPSGAGVTVLLQELTAVDVHWHDFYEIAYVVSGTAEHRLNGRSARVRAGSVISVTPADFHDFTASTSDQLVCLNVVVHPQVVESDLADLAVHGIDWPTAVVPECFGAEGDFRRMHSEAERTAPAAGPLMTALLRCILVEVARASGGAADEAPLPLLGQDDDVRRAIRYVEHHFREPITLAHVAAVASLSPNYFSERFHAVTGTSFQAYLQNARLRFSRSLLACTSLGVTEICRAAGFNDPSHFGRAYRRRYGETPSATRSATLRRLS